MGVRADKDEGEVVVPVASDKIPQSRSVPGNRLGYVGAEGLDRSQVNEPIGREATREIGGGVGGIGKSEGCLSERLVWMTIRHAIEIEGKVRRSAAGAAGGFEGEGGLLDPGGGIGEGGRAKPEIAVSISAGRTAGTRFFGPDLGFGTEVRVG